MNKKELLILSFEHLVALAGLTMAIAKRLGYGNAELIEIILDSYSL